MASKLKNMTSKERIELALERSDCSLVKDYDSTWYIVHYTLYRKWDNRPATRFRIDKDEETVKLLVEAARITANNEHDSEKFLAIKDKVEQRRINYIDTDDDYDKILQTLLNEGINSMKNIDV